MTGKSRDAMFWLPEFTPAEVVCTDTSAPRPGAGLLLQPAARQRSVCFSRLYRNLWPHAPLGRKAAADRARHDHRSGGEG